MKILVIRFSSLGDVVLATALLPNLRTRFPEGEIYFLTKAGYEDLFNNNPHIDHVLVFDSARQPFGRLTQEIREIGFDVIIDLQGNVRSWFIRVMAGGAKAQVIDKLIWARRLLILFKKVHKSLERPVRERILDCLSALGLPVVSTETQLFPSKVEETLQTFSIDPTTRLVGIAPGAKHNTKRWSTTNFAEAANRLGETPGTLVLILGDKSDCAVADQVMGHLQVPYKNLAGWTSLSELTAVVSRLSILLTNDSGLLHMAEALKIPLVALFGPTVRAFGFAPYRETSRVVEVTNLSCRPCTLHGDERCPLGHHRCMEDIDVNAVLYAASDALEKHETSPTG